MKRELRQKWIDALRSGEYEQGHRALKDSDGRYCCLGVLCDVAGAVWTETAPIGSMARFACSVNGTLSSISTLGPNLYKELGLDCSREITLWGMNDNTGASFKEIADWIEQNVPVED